MAGRGSTPPVFFFVCDEGVSARDWFFSLWFGTPHASHIFMCFRLYGFFSPLYQGYFCQGEEEEEEDRG